MKIFLDRLKDPTPMIYDGGFGSQLFTVGHRIDKQHARKRIAPGNGD